MTTTNQPKRTNPQPQYKIAYVDPEMLAQLQAEAAPKSPAPRRTVRSSAKRVKPKLTTASQKIFSTPGMTIEDRLAALLARIMERMDEQIDDQIAKVDKLNEGKPVSGSSSSSGNSTSIDQEMFKLDRLTKKREQMFQMLEGIVKRYTDSAQNVLRSLGQ